ncbi:uncharacterized protein WM277_001484 [Molossus nigricans]
MRALWFQNAPDGTMEPYKSLLMHMKRQCQQLPITIFFSHAPRYPLPTPSTSVEEDDDTAADDTVPSEDSPTEDLSQTEKRLGSFSADPSTYIREFRYLSQTYDLTWHDIKVICTSTLTPEEHERILSAARQQADRDHLIDNTVPLGNEAVPQDDPAWNYQAGPGSNIPRRNLMLQYLLRGMDAVSNKIINYDKLREITQLPEENPALFLNRLQEALVRYTRLDPGSRNGATILASHFISQSAPDIRKKLKKAEEGPETPIRDLVKMAFKVFNAREETAEAARQARLQQKVSLQTQALVAALRPAGEPAKRLTSKGGQRTPPGACFKCGKEGHWAKACPQPRPPTKPCPQCKQMGHWKSDCPTLAQPSAPQCRGTENQTFPALELLGLMDD